MKSVKDRFYLIGDSKEEVILKYMDHYSKVLNSSIKENILVKAINKSIFALYDSLSDCKLSEMSGWDEWVYIQGRKLCEEINNGIEAHKPYFFDLSDIVELINSYEMEGHPYPFTEFMLQAVYEQLQKPTFIWTEEERILCNDFLQYLHHETNLNPVSGSFNP